MLTADPKHWFSSGFTVMEGSQTLAEFDVSVWEKGVLTVQGVSYRAYREGGIWRGTFILESAGAVLARAEKPSAFRSYLRIGHLDKRYILRERSAFGRTLLLLDGDRQIGVLSPRGISRRRVAADLPEALPLPVKVFVIWLAVVLWNRDVPVFV